LPGFIKPSVSEQGIYNWTLNIDKNWTLYKKTNSTCLPGFIKSSVSEKGIYNWTLDFDKNWTFDKKRIPHVSLVSLIQVSLNNVYIIKL
jgi:hypothetical protein